MQEVRCLPNHTDRLFLTDGGIETWLMYKKGFELPHFCDFQLLDDAKGREALRQYYGEFAQIARQHNTGYVFCSLTYRASREWGQLLGYSPSGLAEMNHKAMPTRPTRALRPRRRKTITPSRLKPSERQGSTWLRR